MNDAFRAVILGIVEGLTEFLPVSSTGHMILVEPLLGIKEGDPFWSGTFDIFIQIGAILAVLLYFWRRLYGLVVPTGARRYYVGGGSKNTLFPAGKVIEYPSVKEGGTGARWQDHILFKLFVAFLPAAVVGLLADDFIESHLKTPVVVAGALIVGGIAILLIELFMRRPKYTDAAAIPLRVAFLIGVAQCLSMIPGTSRSAATIMGALVLGLSAPAAAEFSFFLAIPTMFAAGGYSLLKHLDEIERQQFAVLGLGFSVAFVVALVVVAGFMRFIQTHRFTSFAIYRIILGFIVLAVIWRGMGGA
ncbi:MAG TPA: undecaprenyl-diphosphate phosphatase [Phycisphaerae bacterium]|jgi:undecaprenyl-diphosphatase|nr:undecaprenyl-diphosphate phosphatase [Phycisphaerae bacterium]HOB75333.1 undecaprenyl-diphosphate phosphatase [Phycisphaerae bacterium]HOJ53231.1 undecaprenyl-diphosphate phosphatase [Phycisphaerae bacterium]HOL25195.1 undecaprenyl-diphosphate phosphatase [Phycisphaerae bacterium]HPP20251.1 undecaprenyl-diphosphate phosphatase [Phycisphaerae bacterium]